MSADLTPDICVIGAGSGGLSVAAGAAAFGVPVVLIEKARMGGDCLNTGCVPSKALIAAAKHAHAVRTAARFGIVAGPPVVDAEAVFRHVHGAIATIAPHDSVERFEGLGVTVIRDAARFVDPDTVEAGGRRIRARRFVLATGSRAALPPIPGLPGTPHLTNESVFDLTALPSRLIVLGGGPIGCELAQAFARLGCAVEIVQSGTILPKDDPEAVAVVRAALQRDGVQLHENTKAISVEETPAGIRVTTADRVIEGSRLLVAAGRTAVVDGLGLDAAGVATGPRGVVVDRSLRTTNRRVYAVGDVAGGPQFTHAAGQHAGLVLRAALFRLPVTADPDAIPWATYTDPPLAQVGLTEAAARARGPVETSRFAFSGLDRAITEGETEGFIKLVTGRGGRLLGATIVGAGADEMANTLSLALSRGLRARDLVGYVSPYPTRGEAPKRAALAMLAPFSRSPLVRGAIRALRSFG